MRRLFLAVAAIALIAVNPVLAQTEGDTDAAIELEIGDAPQFHAAFDAIKAAVADGDSEALAAYIPIGEPMMINGEQVTYATVADFTAAYDQLFTPEIVDAVTAQTYETLFVNSDGVMLGNGQVWLNGICIDTACNSFDVKIVTIQSTAN